MGRNQSNRLTPVGIRAISTPGYYCDGAGLYLQVSKSGTKSWLFRYTLSGRSREMGLGGLSTRTLAEARAEAKICRLKLKDGVDPIAEREAKRAANLAAQAQKRTFEQCAGEYHSLHAHGWKNPKHGQQWINTLTAYVFPIFGTKDVSDVSKADIIRALEPMWIAKAETASRVKQRIRAVLDWAAARDYRRDHDPHLWDQVARALPKHKDIKRSEHFAACPYSDIYDVLQSIKMSGASDTVKSAAEFIVLTAARSGEVRGAKWSEIDFENKRWIIPGERMKAGREHRVPLSPRAVEILKAQKGKNPLLVFPSDKGRTLSDMTFTMLLRRVGYQFTVHGFRSSFKDWSAERTNFPREVVEAALAHSPGRDAVEAAYFRSDLFEKRRRLMEMWARFCATERATAQVATIETIRRVAEEN